MRSDHEKRIDAHVGRRVCLRRTLLGMNQAELAGSVGLSFQQIQKYERGSTRISAGRLFQFADVLDVPVPFFFDEMPEGIAGRSVGLSDAHVAGSEEDQISRRETLELVKAYYRISNPGDRKHAREFVKLMADLAAGAEAEGE